MRYLRLSISLIRQQIYKFLRKPEQKTQMEVFF